MKITIHLCNGLLTACEKDYLVEHTSFNKSYFKSSGYRGWYYYEGELSQEEMDLEKVAKLTLLFTVEIDGEHIYLTGREYE